MLKISQVIISLLLVSIISLSCSTKPRGILDDSKMINLLKDMNKAEGVMKKDSRYSSVQQKDALLDAVFRKHKTTQEQFEKSLDWYAQNIDQYNTITDSVSAQLEREYQKDSDLKNQVYRFKLTGFSSVLPEYFVLDNNTPTFRFKIDSLEMRNFDKENFLFSFQTRGVDTCFHRAQAVLYFVYADTSVVEKQEIKEDAFYQLLKPNLPDSLLKEISGYVHLRNTDRMTPKFILSDISNKNKSSVNNSDTLNVPKTEEFEIMTTN